MKKISILLIMLLAACATTAITLQTQVLDNAIALTATQNYCPTLFMGMRDPAYTIYRESEWVCKDRTPAGDYICCNKEPFSSMSPWKYCVITDGDFKAYGFVELGSNQSRNWPEGKQDIFQKKK
jgi:hypothetical protein